MVVHFFDARGILHDGARHRLDLFRWYFVIQACGLFNCSSPPQSFAVLNLERPNVWPPRSSALRIPCLGTGPPTALDPVASGVDLMA
jgi:hypothetical protein